MRLGNFKNNILGLQNLKCKCFVETEIHFALKTEGDKYNISLILLCMQMKGSQGLLKFTLRFQLSTSQK